MTLTPAEQEPLRFWCHECGVGVETRVEESSGEICCVQCGSNFVEEIEEVCLVILCSSLGCFVALQSDVATTILVTIELSLLYCHYCNDVWPLLYFESG